MDVMPATVPLGLSTRWISPNSRRKLAIVSSSPDHRFGQVPLVMRARPIAIERPHDRDRQSEGALIGLRVILARELGRAIDMVGARTVVSSASRSPPQLP